MRVTLLLPSQGTDFEKNTVEQTKFVLGLIERLVAYRPLPKIREKLDQLRVNYEATVSVDEEKQKKHEEKLKEEKEKKLAAMDPEQRKKLEEKRSKAKMMKKFKVN